MKTDLFHLEIVPIRNIYPHEEFDISRSYPLVEKLKKDRQLKNPILLTNLGEGRYLELDGINRISSFKILKFKTILAQIIDYNDQEIVELSSWCHLFSSKPEDFLTFVKDIDEIKIKEGLIGNVGYRYIKETGKARLCTVVTKRGKVYLFYTGGGLLQKVDKLRRLVKFYDKSINRAILPENPSIGEIEYLLEEKSKDIMVVFPTFTRHQIVEVVKRGGLLPPGVTRHIIKWRCLNVNVPLSFFSNKKTLKEKNKQLDKILKSRNPRIYEEPTIQFE